MHTAETDAQLHGPAGSAWLVPEPHPGHMLVHRTAPVAGLTWFLLSVDLEPLRLVLRGVDPNHEPEEDVDLVFLGDPLLEVEVPDGLHMEDFVQLPGELARAVVRDIIVPDANLGAQWKAATARVLATLRRRREHGQRMAETRKARAAQKLARDRRAKRRRSRKARS